MYCELCNASKGTLLWRDRHCRVILANDTDYPGFCCVIGSDHIKEMSELSPLTRAELMNTVFAVESAVRKVMQPDKINLAGLGNISPHFHWPAIPRFADEKHYSNPARFAQG